MERETRNEEVERIIIKRQAILTIFDQTFDEISSTEGATIMGELMEAILTIVTIVVTTISIYTVKRLKVRCL